MSNDDIKSAALTDGEDKKRLVFNKVSVKLKAGIRAGGVTRTFTIGCGLTGQQSS